MRFFLNTLLIFLLSFIAGLYLPWWSVAIIAFLVSIALPLRIGYGFLSGFLGVFLLWLILAIWIDAKNDSLLSAKIAALFPLGGSSIILMFLSAFVGALVGGFAAMAGSSLRAGKIIKR